MVSPIVLLGNGQQQFIDGNGVPLAGGKVYFYEVGTTNDKLTYQDPGFLSQNTNPVILDSDGRGTFWGKGLYRQVVYDASGILVWDQVTGETESDVVDSGGFGEKVEISSGNTVDLGTASGHLVYVTGVNSIGAFGNSASITNPWYLIKFVAGLTLMHSTSLLTPTAADVKVSANDYALAEYQGSGIWRIAGIMKASGEPVTWTGAESSIAPQSTIDLGTAASHLVLVDGGLVNQFLSPSGWTSAGWTGSWETGWKHTAGNTSILSQSSAPLTTAVYTVTYVVSSRSTGKITITFGGTSVGTVYASGSVVITTANSQGLQITPTSTFDGTVNITIVPGDNQTASFGSSASLSSPVYLVRFNSTVSLTNSTALALPGGTDINVGPGDSIMTQYLGGGNWRVLQWTNARSANSGSTGYNMVAFRYDAAVQTWQVPNGITTETVIKITAVGAGGGGQGATSSGNGSGGAGGASGAYFQATVKGLAVGDSLSLSIGKGGAGGYSTGSRDGADGTQTTVTYQNVVVITAGPGKGGVSGGSATGTSAYNSSGTNLVFINMLDTMSQNGAVGQYCGNSVAIGGQGGGNPLGQGGATAPVGGGSSLAGQAGAGMGGGGGGGATSSSQQPGGNGADGGVIIEYFISSLG